MNHNRNSFWSTVVMSLVAITAFLNAADDTQMRNLENRVSALEQRKGSNGIINPPARPVVKDGIDLFLKGEALLWRASEVGFEVGLKNSNGTALATDARTISPRSKWDWGFKVAAGCNTPHDGWDLALEWTRFYTHNRHRVLNAPSGGTIFPALVNQGVPETTMTQGLAPLQTGVQKAKPFWGVHFNQLNLGLGREFYVSKWLTLRPHTGVTTAWVRQDFNMHYDGGFLESSFFSSPVNLHTSVKNNFWGMGLSTGVDSKWGLGSGFSIFSDLATSLLFGHFTLTQNESNTSVTPTLNRLHSSEKFRASAPVLDLGIGLMYEQEIGGSYGFTMTLGYTEKVLFNQNRIKKFVGVNDGSANNSGLFVRQNENLSFHGFKLGAQLDF